MVGASWRTVIVELNSMDKPEGAACDACLFLIGTRRGQATAVSVRADGDIVETPVHHITFNWNWYHGTVTWGGEILAITDAHHPPSASPPAKHSSG